MRDAEFRSALSAAPTETPSPNRSSAQEAAREPCVDHAAVARRRAEPQQRVSREARGETLEFGAPFAQRPFDPVEAIQSQDVERQITGRCGSREQRDAAGRRMDALLQDVEGERASNRYDEFAVE